MYKLYLKRIIDFCLAFLGLLFTSPILLIVFVILSILNDGKVFFKQQRPGKSEKIFRLIKFKSMNDKTNVNGELLSDADRLTPFGKLIRKTSIDELPQLWNVLKGDMSLIGPRPLLVSYLPLYNEEQTKRHEVKPGITGWAQVNGRNAISWEKKFEFDVWYVHNCSFLVDLKIIFLTILKIFKGSDISSDTHATMEKFQGS